MEDLQGGTLALEHRYEIEAREGRVAQTTSYRASQYPFSKPVMVSVFDVFEESDAPDALIDRIKNASQEWSQLTHPGVLGCIDYGELTAKVPFVVSERIKAPTLQQWLESSRTMSPEDVVSLVQRLAEIVDFMHGEDVVHGGLGAHCVLLPDEAFDKAMVGHVGLALTMVDLRALESAILTYSSLAPLPPEAFTDDALPEPGWDIYALASLAYTALAGEHPFFDDVNDTSEGFGGRRQEVSPKRSQRVSPKRSRMKPLSRPWKTRWKRISTRPSTERMARRSSSRRRVEHSSDC